MKKTVPEILSSRREKDKDNRAMDCPVTEEFCKTTKCMWYDDEEQECSMRVIATALTNINIELAAGDED